MIVSHPSINQVISCYDNVPIDILGLDLVLSRSSSVEVNITSNCDLFLALILHKTPLNWNEPYHSELKRLSSGETNVTFDVSHFTENAYIYRIWVKTISDGSFTMNKMMVNLQPLQLFVNPVGLLDGDVLHFDKSSNMLRSKQIPYRKVGSHNKPNFIIALTGQSNSQGAGGIYDFNSIDDQPHDRIYSFNIWSKTWGKADLRDFIGTKPPDLQCLAFHFAKMLVQCYSDIRIGIINFGVGGQAISRWVKYEEDHKFYDLNTNSANQYGLVDYGESYGNLMPGVQGDIFDAHVRNINEAMNLLDEENRFIDVICWHQGESNGGNDDIASQYFETSLNKVIAQYRSLEFCKNSTPFIVGETTGADDGSFKGWEARNIELRHLNIDADPFTKCVSSMDLTVCNDETNNGDKIHFSSESHRVLGKRYFDAFRNVFN